MYLKKQTRITMWKVEENMILSFCFENLKQKRKKEATFICEFLKYFCFENLEQKQQI